MNAMMTIKGVCRGWYHSLSPRQITLQRLEQLHSVITSTWLLLMKTRQIPLSYLALLRTNRSALKQSPVEG
jgi:hypothetical protein